MNIVKSWAKMPISEDQYNQLELFKSRVLEVNKYINLTRITSDKDFQTKHIIDSLSLLPFIDEIKSETLIDIGSGAGFPGIIIKIMRPNIKMVLLDSLKKRVNFLNETVKILGLENIECVHSRAEDYKTQKFDICTVRAVANLSRLAAWCLPVLKKGGMLLAMKGARVHDELDKAKTEIHKHGGKILGITEYEIDYAIFHNIIKIKKVI